MRLLEFNGVGEIVWSWNKADLISSLQGVLVLDGMDPAKLHDERNGVMQPVRSFFGRRKQLFCARDWAK